MINPFRALGASTLLLLSATVLAQAPSPSLPSAIAGQALVTFRPGTPGSEIAAAHRQAGATALRRIDALGVEVVAVPSGNVAAVLEAYRNNPNVRYAEPNLLRPLELPDEGQDPQPPWGLGIDYFAEQYGLHNTGQAFFYDEWTGQSGAISGAVDADIDAPEAWDLDTGSSYVTVAVLSDYAARRDAHLGAPRSPYFFVAERGGRLLHQYVHRVFWRLSREVGLRQEGQRNGPRPDENTRRAVTQGLCGV